MTDELQLTITQTRNPKQISKTFFLNQSNQNYLQNNYDTQDRLWTGNQRELILMKYRILHKGIRNDISISNKEQIERHNFHKKTNKDIMYQFNNFYPYLPIHIVHAQVRKNLKQINNELFYTKEYGIESFDLITHKQQTLIGIDDIEGNGAICFDLTKKSNGDFLVCLGTFTGTCELLQITKDDYMQVKRNKAFNNNPQFQLVFTLNKEENEEEFINYVAFLPGNRLLSTSNDKSLLIYDLNKNNEVIFQVKNNEPINHCDINEEKGIIACVGDSYTVDILDMRAKSFVNRIKEHYDFGIAVRFNQFDNDYFATGNQDYSCRIWDIRMLKKSIRQFHGFNDSIGDLVWASKNRIVYGENSFYAHIFDTSNMTLQTLSYLGNLNGLVHSSIDDKIYLAIYEEENGGIMEYSLIDYCYFNIQNMMI